MEKELNIAAILEGKPKGTKLWSPITGDCAYKEYDEAEEKLKVDFYNKYDESCYWVFSKGGRTYSASSAAQLCLFPSKQMQDWSKFAWKKGDVLKVATGSDCSCIFDRFTNDDYTEFTGVFDKYLDRFDYFATSDWCKVTDEKEYESIIQRIETQYGGKLNLDTLKIEKPQFKDGDIFTLDGNETYITTIGIFKGYNNEGRIKVYAAYNMDREIDYINVAAYDRTIRFATDSEKQQLFSALEKEGKAWDADKKAIVDLPKKCEFKAFDKVLVRDTKDEYWRPAFFASLDEDSINEYGYCLIGDPDGVFCKYCIPYNDQTAHLLGTTDDWKGGEE